MKWLKISILCRFVTLVCEKTGLITRNSTLSDYSSIVRNVGKVLFKYDPEKDVYICPAEQQLYFFENTSKNGMKYKSINVILVAVANIKINVPHPKAEERFKDGSMKLY